MDNTVSHLLLSDIASPLKKYYHLVGVTTFILGNLFSIGDCTVSYYMAEEKVDCRIPSFESDNIECYKSLLISIRQTRFAITRVSANQNNNLNEF